MTENDRKTQAQDALMYAMQLAFDGGTDRETRQVMSDQMARVERLFGFVPYSFTRGV